MTAGSKPIAVVQGADGEATQRLLSGMAAACRSAGKRVVGVVAEAHGLPEQTCSAGILRDVASGERYSIYLETPPSHTSCHLDGRGVAAACSSLLGDVEGSDLVILSKFGKLEAAGQGLFPAFQAAIAAGRPLLTSVSSKHGDAWRALAPDAALLEADEAALTA